MRFFILVVLFILSFLSVSFAGDGAIARDVSQLKKSEKNDIIIDIGNSVIDNTINRYGSSFFTNTIGRMVKVFFNTISSFPNPSYERLEKVINDFTNFLPVSIRGEVREKLLDILQYVHNDFYPSIVNWYNKKNVDDGEGLIDIISGSFKIT
jgi:hypothetical protein